MRYLLYHISETSSRKKRKLGYYKSTTLLALPHSLLYCTFLRENASFGTLHSSGHNLLKQTLLLAALLFIVTPQILHLTIQLHSKNEQC